MPAHTALVVNLLLRILECHTQFNWIKANAPSAVRFEYVNSHSQDGLIIYFS
jgi:hypothetical protein